ncbi:unnamed protein product [Paramecium octaurelia]|uniref:Uncharacterized protein n=1 Tax=Paramecium octaurelia TaxID=43137 RepID=A0A8S1V299_PAROT|nr:unnamed protein product [Paramecium octaurelia]
MLNCTLRSKNIIQISFKNCSIIQEVILKSKIGNIRRCLNQRAITCVEFFTKNFRPSRIHPIACRMKFSIKYSQKFQYTQNKRGKSTLLIIKTNKIIQNVQKVMENLNFQLPKRDKPKLQNEQRNFSLNSQLKILLNLKIIVKLETRFYFIIKIYYELCSLGIQLMIANIQLIHLIKNSLLKSNCSFQQCEILIQEKKFEILKVSLIITRIMKHIIKSKNKMKLVSLQNLEQIKFSFT